MREVQQLNSVEFRNAVLDLGCPEKAATNLIRLASRLSTNCTSVSLDDLFALSLTMIPRAQATYRGDRPAAFTTHLVTVVRNACLSLLSKERTHCFRHIPLDRELHDILSERAPPDVSVLRDELDALEQILSPYAWRMLDLIVRSSPVVLSNRAVSEQLSLSATSVNHLRDEVRHAASAIFDCSSTGKVKSR